MRNTKCPRGAFSLAKSSASGYKKRAGGATDTPARRDSSPELQVLSSSAPARVRTSCRGRLLSTFHQVDKQSHDNAGHNLRGYVQQELLHLGILLYRRTAPEPF